MTRLSGGGKRIGDPSRCKARVIPRGNTVLTQQCRRRPWKDGYCQQHHPDSEEARHVAKMKKIDEHIAFRRSQDERQARRGAAMRELIELVRTFTGLNPRALRKFRGYVGPMRLLLNEIDGEKT